jgi:hypothetical protein
MISERSGTALDSVIGMWLMILLTLTTILSSIAFSVAVLWPVTLIAHVLVVGHAGYIIGSIALGLIWWSFTIYSLSYWGIDLLDYHNSDAKFTFFFALIIMFPVVGVILVTLGVG